VVHPREAAKAFPGYDTDAEILLGCVLTSGTYDTSEICRTEIHLANELAPPTGIEAEHYEDFRRVRSQPTEEGKVRVINSANEIAAAIGSTPLPFGEKGYFKGLARSGPEFRAGRGG